MRFQEYPQYRPFWPHEYEYRNYWPEQHHEHDGYGHGYRRGYGPEYGHHYGYGNDWPEGYWPQGHDYLTYRTLPHKLPVNAGVLEVRKRGRARTHVLPPVGRFCALPG